MAAKSSLPYEIGRFNATCDQTGKKLLPGESFYAALVDDEDAILKRVNIAAEEWESGNHPKRPFAYWRATVAESEPEQSNQIDHDSLLSLFESIDPQDAYLDHDLPDDGQPANTDSRAAFRFILALMLQRKKILLPATGGHPDPTTLALVPKTNKESTPFLVQIPALDAAALAKLTEQLREILHLGDDS